jgi:beta-galactosidase
MEADVKTPALWSSETPNLYILTLTLKNDKGEVLEARSNRTGFRKVEFKNSELYVNGKREYIYGVNRHEHNAWEGKTIPYETMVQDVKLMKQYGFNSVRTSHYPDCPEFYDLCDEYGIYVMDEANVETCGADAELSNNEVWLFAQLERVTGMVKRDKNHPSVIFWSLGNESGVGYNNAARAAWVKDYDPTRLLHFEAYLHNGGSRQYGYGLDFMLTNRPAVNPPEPPAVDVVSTMYPSVEGIIRLATQENENRPVLMCEYAHAKGNALGNHQEYWDAVKKYPRLIGGYIWDWADQSLARKDSLTGKEYLAAPTGTNGVVSADRKVRPAMYECKKIYQHIAFDYNAGSKELTIKNEYNYLPLSTFNFSWSLKENGTTVDSGKFPDVQVQPGSSEKIKISPNITDLKGEVILEVNAHLKESTRWAAKDFEIAWEQFILQKNPIPSPVIPIDIEKETPLTIKQTSNETIISNNTFKIVFNKQSGLIQQWESAGKELLERGPQLNVWRAPTNNDGGYRPQAYHAAKQWVDAGLDSLQHKLKSFNTVKRKDASVVVTTNLRAQKKGNPASIDYTTTYTIMPSGKVQIDTDIKPVGETLISFARIGYSLIVKKGFEQFSWYGYGPYDTYNDRHSGARIGMFTGTVDEQFTHYAYPQENGNKYRCSWASLTDNQDMGLVAEGMPTIESSAMHYSLDNLSEAMDESQLKYTDNIIWNIDCKTYPIGNRSCGPPPLDKYLLLAQPVSFSFTITPNIGIK